jgi:hypothetical protein
MNSRPLIHHPPAINQAAIAGKEGISPDAKPQAQRARHRFLATSNTLRRSISSDEAAVERRPRCHT